MYKEQWFFLAQEFPESELIRQTFTIRAMDLPPNIQLTKRAMLRWFALSFGLISEKESRSTILDVLDALFFFHFAKKQPSTNEILEFLQQQSKPVSDKLLRYHLKRLIDAGFLQRKKLKYFFAHSPYAEKHDLKAGFNHNVTSSINKSLADIESVLDRLSHTYRQ